MMYIGNDHRKRANDPDDNSFSEHPDRAQHGSSQTMTLLERNSLQDISSTMAVLLIPPDASWLDHLVQFFTPTVFRPPVRPSFFAKFEGSVRYLYPRNCEFLKDSMHES